MGSSAASQVTVPQGGAIRLDPEGINRPASKAAIAFLILFLAVYGWGYQPLLALYPTEVLSTEQRSTGMGLLVLSLNLASMSFHLFVYRLTGSFSEPVCYPHRPQKSE